MTESAEDESRIKDDLVEQLLIEGADGWPALARRWFDNGIESAALLDYTVLPYAQALAHKESMREVLDSISPGFDLPLAMDIEDALFEVSDFKQRCLSALARVRADLDATVHRAPVCGLRRSSAPGWPLRLQVELGGIDGAELGDYVAPGLDLEDTIIMVALSAANSYQVVSGRRWPHCPDHPNTYLTPRTGHDGRAHWTCSLPPWHETAVIGQLNPRAGR